MFVSHSFAGQNFPVLVLDRFLFIWETKTWSLVVLDRWLSYKETNLCEFAWADFTLAAKSFAHSRVYFVLNKPST